MILVQKEQLVEFKLFEWDRTELLESIKERPKFISRIAYDPKKENLVWLTDNNVYVYQMIEKKLTGIPLGNNKFVSVAYFGNKIILIDGYGTGYVIKEKDFKRENDFGTVSAITTSSSGEADIHCKKNNCLDKICISSKSQAICLCPVIGSLENCKDLPKEKVAIGVLISGRKIVRFYPDSSGIFHSENVYKFSETLNTSAGDYYIKENSLIYSLSGPSGSKFYKINLYNGIQNLISKLDNVQVKSLSVDQRTGNIYISTNYGIRILAENGKWGRFKSTFGYSDIGRIFTDPFKFSLLFFHRKKFAAENQIQETTMSLKDKGQKLFFFDPTGVFGVELRANEHVISGHVKSKTKNTYQILVEPEIHKHLIAYLDQPPSHINSHYDQLFYSVDDKLYSYNLGIQTATSRMVLQTDGSIAMLRIFTRDLKTILAEKTPCNDNSCSDVCISVSKKDYQCFCPDHSFLKDDKSTCFSPECHFESQFWCDGRCKNLTTDYCNEFDDCKQETDEFDCEYDGWKKNYCPEESYLCQTSFGIKCYKKRILCKYDEKPDCLNKVDKKEICKEFSVCKPNQFKCKSSSSYFAHCVDSRAVCNGVRDCDDNSDEEECRSCGSLEFPCIQNKTKSICIPNTKVCNGENDCFNGIEEDEKFCSKYCHSDDKFKCDDMGHTCILKKYTCDGYYQCSDGSDEKNCVPCSESDINCEAELGNEICATKCDGKKECKNGIDEENCCKTDQVKCYTPFQCVDHDEWCKNSWSHCDNPVNVPSCPSISDEAVTSSPYTTVKESPQIKREPKGSSFPISSITSEPVEYGRQSTIVPTEPLTQISAACLTDEKLCSDGLTCMKLKHFCDGMDDCPDKSDEGDICKKVEVCNDKCKPGKCHLLSNGSARCECGKGYKLEEGNSCENIDECNADMRPCDQFCADLQGSFQCTCVTGYKLQTAGVCDAGHDPVFYFTSKHKVYVNAGKNDHFTPYTTKDKKNLISAITGDLKNQIYSVIYEKSSIIYKMNEYEEVSILKEFKNSEITGLAYDWFNKNVYYSEIRSNNGKETGIIGVCNFEGSKCKNLRKGFSRYTQIAVDPIGGNMYWVELNAKNTIRKADVSGHQTSISIVFDHDLENPPLLAIDYVTNFVYAYYDGKLHWIDSKNPERVQSRELRLNAPKSMDFFESKI